MDISALLGLALVPVAGAPAGPIVGGAAVAGDAFAAVFAAALPPTRPQVGGAVVPMAAGVSPIPTATAGSGTANLAVAPSLPSIEPPQGGTLSVGALPPVPLPKSESVSSPQPLPLAVNLPEKSEGATPTAVAAPSLPDTDAPKTNATKADAAKNEAPEAVAADQAATDVVPETGSPQPAKIRAPRTAPTRVRAKPSSPPDPPPTLAVPTALEKEAPTNAPNAPVTPLDRSSEKKATETTGALLAPTPAPAVVAPVASGPLAIPAVPTSPQADAVLEPSPVSAAPAILSPSGPMAQASSIPKVASATVLDGPEVGSPANAAEDTPVVVDTAVSFASKAVLDDSNSTPAPSAPTPLEVLTPVALTKLASAPDLGIVAPVLQVPVAQGPVPVAVAAPAASIVSVAAAPNAQVAQVAAGRAAPAPVDKPEAPTAKSDPTKVEAPLMEPAVARKEASKGDDEPAGDAPNDPAPQPALIPIAKTAATERPEAGDDRALVDRHLVVRQVADRIESLAASRPKDGVTIHLEPRDLGTVTLVVKGMQKALDVQVFASDDRVRQGLDASRSELAQSLVPRGIAVRELRVSTPPPASPSSTGSSANGGPNSQPNADSQGRPRSPSPSISFPKASHSAKPTSTPSRAARSGRGVDLLV